MPVRRRHFGYGKLKAPFALLLSCLCSTISAFNRSDAAQSGLKPKAPDTRNTAAHRINLPHGTDQRGSVQQSRCTPTQSELHRYVQELRDLRLLMPLDGFQPGQMKDSFYEKRGAQMHGAVDMLAPRYTTVHAVCDGTIAKLFHSRLGGMTIYQFDTRKHFVFYYAHLQSYADGLREGEPVKKGAAIGFVGTSGNAPPNTPHLHFSVSVLGLQKQWWKGTIPIDPYEVFAQPNPPAWHR